MTDETTIERTQDESLLERLGVQDPGVGMVMEFHEAFNCHIAERPTVPPLDGSDVQTLLAYAGCFDDVALELKRVAALANRAGRVGLGLVLIRLQLHLEESCAEFARACAERDLVKILDSLADSRYVVNGSFMSFGLQEAVHAADYEVHSSNMSKLDEDGKPILSEAGRVIKGPNYRPADLAAILEALLVE